MRYILLLFTILMLGCTTTRYASIPKTTPPNIIVFLVDDMGLMDTSVPFLTDTEGNPVSYPLNSYYHTPNIELLAAQGIRFSNFYAHSVCSPTRSSLLTGQNSARHRTTNWIYSEKNNPTEFGPKGWNWKGLTKESITLPRMLQQVGYKTIHVGKAHLGPFGSDGEDPLNLGFDVNIAGSSIGHPGSYYGQDGFGAINGQKERAVPGLEKYHGQDIFLTEALTLEAKSAISQAREEGKPFFLNMAHYAVHAPFQSDPRFADRYKNSGKSEKAQAYATLIEGIDKSLGDIIQHVQEMGEGENTLILFLGDNGSDAPLPIEEGYSSSSPLRGKKGNHWEGGIRVPFIASWVTPNSQTPSQKQLPIAQQAIQPQIGTILDIFPTLCQLAAIPIPNRHEVDGYALHQQLAGQHNDRREESFLNHFPHSHNSSYFTSLVDSDWKIIYHYQVEGQPKYELFNMKEDPFEATNLAKKQPEQLTLMMKRLADEMKSKKALFPEKGGKPLELIMPGEGSGEQVDSSRIVTVLSFNILHGRTTKGDFNLDVLANLIQDANPDFVAMQEVDFRVNRSQKYDLASELGWRTKMTSIFARAMYYDGGEYGEAALSKYSFLSSRNVALPYLPGEEPRAAIEIVVELPSKDTMAFVGTHLAHEGNAGRELQAKKINEVFSQNKYPTILVGDLNALPGSGPINILEEAWKASYDKDNPQPTFPSDNPTKKIDYVMFYPPNRWKVLDRKVIQDTVASDHCAYLVTLELLDD